jgi:hypothetical protein
MIQNADPLGPFRRDGISSEVIESIFGKLKYLEKSQSTNGFTGLILSIAANQPSPRLGDENAYIKQQY